MTRKIFFSFLLASLLFLVSSNLSIGQAQEDLLAPDIVVNTLVDNPRGCPQSCTLRSAISDAQSGDVIGFEGGLSGILILVQPLVIEKDITILGPGADLIAIDGNDQLRVFQIHSQAIVKIHGLKIQNGRGSEDMNAGGGIINHATLELSGVSFEGNSAGSGGGIANYGKLTITESSFTNNESTGDGPTVSTGGGAIFSNSPVPSSENSLEVTSSTFENNQARTKGGAIYISQGSSEVTTSTFSDNRANDGGAIVHTGFGLTIMLSDFEHNSATYSGGAVDGRSLWVIGSTFSGNEAQNGSGGAIQISGSTLLDNTIIDNSATYGAGIFIAADISGSSTLIHRNTVRNNTATDVGGGINIHGFATISSTSISGNEALSGGGVYLTTWGVNFVNVTIADNVAVDSGGGIYSKSDFALDSSTIANNAARITGGIFLAPPRAWETERVLTIGNTIIANNEGGAKPDLHGEVTSLGNNLIGNADGTSGWFAGDLLDVDPLLDELKESDNNSWTIALLPGSPAIGAGFCQGDPPVLEDQRGMPRKTPCDIGAYETQS